MSKHLPEDEILAPLLEREAVWQQAYAVYRQPFVAFFTDYHDLHAAEAASLLVQAFAELQEQLYNKDLRPPFKRPLFGYVLLLAQQFLSEKKMPVDNKSIRQATKYYESDTLILLVKANEPEVFDRIHESYKRPTLLFLHKNFEAATETPAEIYGEAMSVLYANIQNDRIELPMRARLMTYFFRVAYNTFANFLKKKETYQLPDNLPEPEAELPPTEQTEYIDVLLEEQTDVQLLSFTTEAELVDELLAKLKPMYQKTLRLRYLDDLNYDEIAQRLDISAATARKRVFDGLRKLRTLLHQKNTKK